MIKQRTFSSKQELFKYLKDNKSLLIEEKKLTVKKADAICYVYVANDSEKKLSTKDLLDSGLTIEDIKSIDVLLVINSTNIMDSHQDVHIPGLWKKSLSEKKAFLLLQEHEMCFENVITDSAKGYTKKMNWTEIGQSFDGQTEALLFDATVKSDRNEYMFGQYVKGHVKNHSVGMRYVNLFMCINSEEKYYREEKDNWDKYIKQVANQQDAIDNGFFWAVTEAKIIEGSAVVAGSNSATPTLSVQETKKTEPSDDTQDDEPHKALLAKQQADKRKLLTTQF